MMKPVLLLQFCLFTTIQGYQSLNGNAMKYINFFFRKMEISSEEKQEKKLTDGIFPGTLWCGTGDISPDNNSLGPLNAVDACCRDHDRCPDVIVGGGHRHGLVNSDPIGITRLHCQCDDKFRNCLANVPKNSRLPKMIVASHVVGMLYFSVLRSNCYKKIVRQYCTSYSKTKLGQCDAYQNYREPARYMWVEKDPWYFTELLVNNMYWIIKAIRQILSFF